MSDYERRWYLCELADGFEAAPEPDWSRVPDAKREAVRARWLAGQESPPVVQVNLWGPDIPWYARQPQYTVRVL